MNSFPKKEDINGNKNLNLLQNEIKEDSQIHKINKSPLNDLNFNLKKIDFKNNNIEKDSFIDNNSNNLNPLFNFNNLQKTNFCIANDKKDFSISTIDTKISDSSFSNNENCLKFLFKKSQSIESNELNNKPNKIFELKENISLNIIEDKTKISYVKNDNLENLIKTMKKYLEDKNYLNLEYKILSDSQNKMNLEYLKLSHSSNYLNNFIRKINNNFEFLGNNKNIKEIEKYFNEKINFTKKFILNINNKLKETTTTKNFRDIANYIKIFSKLIGEKQMFIHSFVDNEVLKELLKLQYNLISCFIEFLNNYIN